MWKRVGGFVRRHKRLVIATGVTAAVASGAYYAYRRVVSEAERFTLQLQQQMAEHQRLQLALRHTADESHATMQRFLPRLKRTLCERVDLEEIVQELKRVDRQDKGKRNALWERAKVTAMVRFWTAIVAVSLWHVLVFAQLSIIGKQTFEQQQQQKKKLASPEDGEGKDTEAEAEQHQQQAQHEFLASGLEYFLSEGLERLTKHVEEAVAANEQFKSWHVSRKARVERDEVEGLLQSLVGTIVPQLRSPQQASDNDEAFVNADLWRSFLIYSEKREGQSENVVALLNDLWDLLETDLFAEALKQSLHFVSQRAFQSLTDVTYGRLDTVSHPPIQNVNEEENNEVSAPSSAPAPALAKLIPILQTEANKLLTIGSAESTFVPCSHGLTQLEGFRNFCEAMFFVHEDGNDPRMQFV